MGGPPFLSVRQARRPSQRALTLTSESASARASSAVRVSGTLGRNPSPSTFLWKVSCPSSVQADEGHETFHKKVEGLGFLPNVPLTRTAEDARALADSLVKVSAL